MNGYIDIIVKMETAYKAQEGKYGNIKENVSFYGRDKREKKEKKYLTERIVCANLYEYGKERRVSALTLARCKWLAVNKAAFPEMSGRSLRWFYVDSLSIHFFLCTGTRRRYFMMEVYDN